MAQEILDALMREGFTDRDANTVGFELFDGVWLEAIAEAGWKQVRKQVRKQLKKQK